MKSGLKEHLARTLGNVVPVSTYTAMKSGLKDDYRSPIWRVKGGLNLYRDEKRTESLPSATRRVEERRLNLYRDEKRTER